MGQVIQFESQAVARLRQRLGAAEQANEALIAFARGHSGAVASIHAAVLEAIAARSIEELLELVCSRWPDVLGIDFIAVAVTAGDRSLRADPQGIERVEQEFVERMAGGTRAVEMRSVKVGHPLFGVPVAAKVRAEAVIRVDGADGPIGLIALGQRAALAIDGSHGSHLLYFLGSAAAATISRCVER
jgi:uncharacterized protein YigA (DUF484 family)